MQTRPVAVLSLHPRDPHYTPKDTLTLPHHERTLRRKVLTCDDGLQIAFDLPKAVTLGHHDLIALENGSHVLSVAAPEPCHEIVPSGRAGRPNLAELAWHLGNRHARVQIVLPPRADPAVDREGREPTDATRRGRILIARDPVLARMAEGMGAAVREVTEPFEPIVGAYHAHGHSGHSH